MLLLSKFPCKSYQWYYYHDFVFYMFQSILYTFVYLQCDGLERDQALFVSRSSGGHSEATPFLKSLEYTV